MSIFSEHADGIKEVESEHGDSITWNGADYPIISGSKTKGGNLAIGGVEISFDFSCTVRRSLFSTLPKAKQTITHGTDTLRIESVIEAGGGSHVRLLCSASNKGN